MPRLHRPPRPRGSRRRHHGPRQGGPQQALNLPSCWGRHRVPSHHLHGPQGGAGSGPLQGRGGPEDGHARGCHPRGPHGGALHQREEERGPGRRPREAGHRDGAGCPLHGFRGHHEDHDPCPRDRGRAEGRGVAGGEGRRGRGGSYGRVLRGGAAGLRPRYHAYKPLL